MSGVHLCRSLAVPFSAIAGHRLLWAERCPSPCSAGFPDGPGGLAGLDVCEISEIYWHTWGYTIEREAEGKCKYIQRR